MVKLNLKKKKDDLDLDEDLLDDSTFAGLNIDSTLVFQIALKLMFVGFCLMGIKIYEIYNINQLKDHKTKRQEVLDSKKSSLTQLQKQVASLDYLKDEAKEYERKRNIIKKLALLRLKLPEILDQMQNTITEYIWLKNLKINTETKKIVVDGEGENENELKNFVELLRKNFNFENVRFDTNDLMKDGSVIKVQFKLEGDLLFDEEGDQV